MRRLAALIAFATLLVAPAAASAKEITKVRACGVDSCVTTRDPAILAGLMDGGPPQAPPAMRGGVISLRSSISEGDETVAHFTSWWVPELHMLVAEDGTWMRLPALAQRRIRSITGEFRPFPASKIGLATPTPAPARPAPASDGGGGPAWLLIVLGAAALGLVAVLVVRRRPRGDFPVPAP
jgi:hypothetical protein